MYLHRRPRFTHREHVGFSFWHLTLDKAQAWQLSRSLGAAEVVELRAVEELLEDELVPSPGEGNANTSIAVISNEKVWSNNTQKQNKLGSCIR